MFVTYEPEGQAPQEFEWNPGRVKLREASAIETTYSKLVGEGKTFQQFIQDVRQGSAQARLLLLFRLLRTLHPTMRFDDLDPCEGEVKVTFSKAELEELRANIEKTKSLAEADRDQILAQLDQEIAEAPDGIRDPGKAAGSSGPETNPSEMSGGSTN